jgi:hypothetical protein
MYLTVFRKFHTLHGAEWFVMYEYEPATSVKKEVCDDVVGIVTRLRTGRSGVRFPVGARDFNWLLGPPILVLNAVLGLFTGG